MVTHTLLHISLQGLIDFTLSAHFLEIAHVDFPVPSSILIRRSMFARVQNSMWGLKEEYLVKQRSQMIHVTKTQQSLVASKFLFFLSYWSIKHICISSKDTYFGVMVYNCCSLSLWICFKDILNLGKLKSTFFGIFANLFYVSYHYVSKKFLLRRHHDLFWHKNRSFLSH